MNNTNCPILTAVCQEEYASFVPEARAHGCTVESLGTAVICGMLPEGRC